MAQSQEEKRAQKRKDLIKNILIVFLIVMLLLTFFSGTIQNWSLPEVATAYVQQGNVSPQVRGSGTVEADDPYNIEPRETRKIASVQIKVGDEVKQGDVLFKLEGEESEELEEALKALQATENEYELALFTGDVTDEIISRVRSGQSGTASGYQARLKEVNDAYNNAMAADNQAQNELDLLKAEYDVKLGELLPVDVTAITIANAEAEAEIAKLTPEETEKSAQVTAIQAEIAALELSVGELENSVKTLTDPAENAKARADLDQAKKDLADAKKRLEAPQKRLGEITARKTQLQNEVADNTRNATTWTAQYEQAKAALEQEYNQKKVALDAKKAQTAVAVAKTKETRDAAIAAIQSELTLSGKYDSLTSAAEKVEKLRAESLGSEITSPVDGIVTAVNYTAGQTMKADEPAAVIQVKGKAMTMTFSVTAEQARSLKVGDLADPQDAWRYSEFKAQITAIRPDQQDPGNKRSVTVSIDSPEVQAGQTVNIRIGDAQKSYEMTVPNSAIKEDNNGKFILIVQARSSPLRNRYIARRVDVEVLAQDDTTTAINAALEGYDYVITTSTAPITAGQEVRLAETGY
ncbi:MAG: HlyD family efflux transporter periplasmic adaptor subunit [Lachnospiraceae bacterium]|nr:HlyD family efflux transporter periplasmic adaptor subunit [Lachnospiraceae bacterium]